jgi:hypothetical protein
MTRAEYDSEIILLKAKAMAAAADQKWRTSMLACMDLAELALDHPEFWPDHVDHEQLKRACEEIVERTEKALGMQVYVKRSSQ